MAEIYINEIHPNPTEGFEWVEVFNNTDAGISASRIKIYDQTSKNLKFNRDILQPNSYIIATASAVLNNSGDTVLLELDGVVLDTVTFGFIDQGKSYARCDNEWIENVLTSYDFENFCSVGTILSSIIVPTPIPTASLMPEVTRQYYSVITPKSEKVYPARLLMPIDFKAKHATIDGKKSPTPLITKPSITISPKAAPSTLSGATPLLAIGVISFIQCVFLVYLIIKRVQFYAPFEPTHEIE